MKNNDMIVLKDVSFSYNEEGEASVNDINLSIKEGEVVVLCGESGCGKSTIIRLINGLIPFYYKGEVQGEVIVAGKHTKDGTIYDIGRKVSTVFQNPKSQFFCVDVVSELAFCAENIKLGKEEILKRINLAADKLDFRHLLNRTMFQLSGGEKQKIACASVSITDNSIVVLDEPSSNLDMFAIGELKKMIAYWKKQGKTIVIAEHRLQYLMNIADRFIYMKDGRLVKEYTNTKIQQVPAQELTSMGLRNVSYDSLDIKNDKVADNYIKIVDFAFKYKGSREANLSIDKLDLPKSSVIAIIGKNGAGKSTFVRCFCGLDRHAKGYVVDGTDKVRAKKRLNSSFLVMQDVNRQLFTESVSEEVEISMAEQNQEILDNILKEFDLYDYKDQHPMSLSGGQKQRVAVACAVASQRDYIVFDEPTSGLDYYHMQQVANCVKRLQKKGKTVFIITHDIELIYLCCNYVLWVDDGRVKDMYQMNQKNEYKLREFFRLA